jgi:NOL1/NOP2/fmu family ribosome biogenesis protein
MVALNSKERKKLNEMLHEQYLCEPLEQLFFCHNDRISCISPDIVKIPFESLPLNSRGMQFGEYTPDKSLIRLSIEGAQIVAKTAKRNCLQLTQQQLSNWISGQDIPVEEDMQQQLVDTDGFVLVLHNTDCYGVGREKNGKLLNFIPKARRIAVDKQIPVTAKTISK